MNLDALHYLDKVRAIAFNLPGVTEGSCYGTPGFYVGKKLFARLREEGDILVIYTEKRDKWMDADPETFYITDHYRNSMYMLVKLNKVIKADLITLITDAWQKRATKKLLAQWDEQQGK